MPNLETSEVIFTEAKLKAENATILSILGPAGAGKGTAFPPLIKAIPRATIFSVGDIIRNSKNPANREHKYYKELKAGFDHMKKGNLMPNEPINSVVKQEINHWYEEGMELIAVDGWPRNPEQGGTAEEIEENTSNTMVYAGLIITRSIGHTRLESRIQEFAAKGLQPREDDTHEVYDTRFDEWEAQTRPLARALARGGKIVLINGAHPIEVVRQEVIRKLTPHIPALQDIRVPA
jgi:adenylate kinase family enzyme